MSTFKNFDNNNENIFLNYWFCLGPTFMNKLKNNFFFFLNTRKYKTLKYMIVYVWYT